MSRDMDDEELLWELADVGPPPIPGAGGAAARGAGAGAPDVDGPVIGSVVAGGARVGTPGADGSDAGGPRTGSADARQAGRSGRDESGVAGELPEAALQTYRRGQMPDLESDRLEAVLIARTSERRRLELLAGIRILAPASVRRRLFGEAATAAGRSPRAGWRGLPWRGLAAASIGVLALFGLWRARELGLLPGTGRPVSVSALPEYRIAITGAARIRSAAGETGRSVSGSAGPEPGEPGANGTSAGPETVVEITLQPDTAPSTSVEFGVYRQDEDGVQRVPGNEILALETNRGAATLKLAAKSLVGESEGERSFYIVVCEPGRLRERVGVGGTTSAAAALHNATGGRVYERTITILAP